MLDVLDAAALRGWVSAGREVLAAARPELDALNVYPVADHDTGTNLLVTIASVDDALSADDELSTTAQTLCRAALTGAHGNSGVIMSQLLRGLLEGLEGRRADGTALAAGLQRAADLAYAAVAVPVEGTVLTVARGAAVAAARAGAVLGDVTTAARLGAEEALLRTPELLPALRAAGVVDAAGRGLALLLGALEAVVHERPLAPTAALLVERDRTGLARVRESGSPDQAYEVQYLLHGASEEAVTGLRARLARLGDSLVLVGADGLHNVHVHVNDVAGAIEAGIEAGRPSRLTVTRFEDHAPVSARSVVAIVPGRGLREAFVAAGAHVVPAVPPPTAADVVAVARATGSAEIVLLPHDAASSAVAAAAAGELGASVVRACSAVQALAALAVAEPSLPLADDVAAMSAAAAATRWASVSLAAQSADTSAGPCLPGDALGLVDGTVVLVGAEVLWVARHLVDRLAAGAELLTVVVGERAPASLGEHLAAHAAARHPHLAVTVLPGGQPLHVVLLGAE